MPNIELKQLPVISHRLLEVGKKVTDRIGELNIDNLIANEDTVKVLKDMRAELNKELAEFETDRKTVKKAIAVPYEEFEQLYKAEILEKYTGAIDTLKSKIASVEIKLKEEKRDNVKRYFEELCKSENIDFVKFEQVGLDINLSTSEKAYKDKCNEFVTRLVDDVKLIESQEHQAEIMAEFKKTLNASAAITTVTKRIEEEKAELKRIEEQEWNRRLDVLRAMAMTYHQTTNTIEYSEEIYTSADKVRNMSKVEFGVLVVELDEAIKAERRRKEKERAEMEAKISQPTKEEAPQPKETAAPLKAPVVVAEPESKLEIVEAVFKCRATLPKLKALGEYLRNNGIEYTNL